MSEVSTTGHPKGLYTLFFSEMWERFCYYGMRTLLTLYLVKSLFKGDAEASLLYGAYTGLVYAAPILGGRMADKYLGYRYAVILGGILMAIGEFLILGGNHTMLLIGMGALIIGNGYFKANISTIVGKLYKDGDPRRDSGFTIFYIGINVGALLATTVVAFVGETYGFEKGFALAGIGMLAGIFIFWSGRKNYAAAEGLEITEAGRKKILGPFSTTQVITIASLLLIPVCYFLIENNYLLNYLFLALLVYVAYSLISAGVKEGRTWRDRMIALVIFIIINVVFWACFEQAGTSLTLFADRNVDRNIFGWQMPASMTQFFNPFFIIVFGSLFSVMWQKLNNIGKNPSIPLKFAFGIFQLGLGFLVTKLAFGMADSNFQVPLLTLVVLYMLHTTGELFLSPIGLSMVTKLSPKHMAGTAMGAWFLSFAIANLLGGQIAALTGGGHGAEEEKKEGFTTETTAIEAANMDGMADFNIEAWPYLDENIKQKKELPKNITYGKWLDVLDWVEYREGVNKDMSLEAWQASRSLTHAEMTASEWLDKSKWEDLQDRYEQLMATDYDNADKYEEMTVENRPLDRQAWEYFKKDIDKVEGDNLSLIAGLKKNQSRLWEAGLTRYTSVFTTIGLVLIAFSILIALLNKPLKKLMHGVN